MVKIVWGKKYGERVYRNNRNWVIIEKYLENIVCFLF